MIGKLVGPVSFGLFVWGLHGMITAFWGLLVGLITVVR